MWQRFVSSQRAITNLLDFMEVLVTFTMEVLVTFTVSSNGLETPFTVLLELCRNYLRVL